MPGETDAGVEFEVGLSVDPGKLVWLFLKRSSVENETTAVPSTQESTSSTFEVRTTDVCLTDVGWDAWDKNVAEASSNYRTKLAGASSGDKWDDVETAGQVVGIILQALAVAAGALSGGGN